MNRTRVPLWIRSLPVGPYLENRFAIYYHIHYSPRTPDFTFDQILRNFRPIPAQIWAAQFVLITVAAFCTCPSTSTSTPSSQRARIPTRLRHRHCRSQLQRASPSLPRPATRASRPSALSPTSSKSSTTGHLGLAYRLSDTSLLAFMNRSQPHLVAAMANARATRASNVTQACLNMLRDQSLILLASKLEFQSVCDMSCFREFTPASRSAAQELSHQLRPLRLPPAIHRSRPRRYDRRHFHSPTRLSLHAPGPPGVHRRQQTLSSRSRFRHTRSPDSRPGSTSPPPLCFLSSPLQPSLCASPSSSPPTSSSSFTGHCTSRGCSHLPPCRDSRPGSTSPPPLCFLSSPLQPSLCASPSSSPPTSSSSFTGHCSHLPPCRDSFPGWDCNEWLEWCENGGGSKQILTPFAVSTAPHL